MREFWLPGRPVPASRPRGKSGQGGYYEEPYRSWLDVAHGEALRQRVRPVLDSAVRASVRVTPDGIRVQVTPYPEEPKALRYGLRGDLDNYVKGALDALTGSAYVRDSQVVRLDARFMQGGDDG